MVTAEPDTELFMSIYNKYGQLTHSPIDPGTYHIDGHASSERSDESEQLRRLVRALAARIHKV